MTQTEFYCLPEIVEQIEIQKRNRFDSEESKAARRAMVDIADKYGVGDEYRKAGGGME